MSYDNIKTKWDRRNNKRMKDKYAPKIHKLLWIDRWLSKSMKKRIRNSINIIKTVKK